MDIAADYLRRFREWVGRGGKQDRPPDPVGIQPKGGSLPAGVVAAVPADQAAIYLVLTGSGACWQPGPSINPLQRTGTGAWSGSFPGGRVGRCQIDAIEVTNDGGGTSTVNFVLNGQVVLTLGMINGVGGGAAGKCGCGQITMRSFA